MHKFPKEFEAALNQHFGKLVTGEVLVALQETPSVSLRKHPLKPSHIEWPSTAVPWCANGFVLDKRPSFAKDPRFHGGAYYVQESSSMVLGEVMRQLNLHSRPLHAVDLCAAPGGKSTLLIDTLHDQSTIVCNEVDGKRNAILRENLLKWGASNTVVTKSSIDKLSQAGSVFDLVLLDAPCSGEGMFRKDAFALEQWNLGLVEQCARIQAELIAEAYAMLKPGGHLIYSTCTLNPLENETNIQQAIDIGFSLSLPATIAGGDRLHKAKVDGQHLGYYLLPGKSTGEGLFFSALKKTGTDEYESAKRAAELSFLSKDQLIPEFDFEIDRFHCYLEHQSLINAYSGDRQLLQSLTSGAFITQVGIPVLERKGRGMIPHHGLAMSTSTRPEICLTKDDALDYLRKSKSPPSTGSKGWKTVGFEEVNLGWVKDLQNRTNNYYPSSLRLRH